MAKKKKTPKERNYVVLAARTRNAGYMRDKRNRRPLEKARKEITESV